jgi:hypothetical protein
MSNIQVFNPAANRPAFAAKGAVSAITKALAGGGAQGKRISIKGCVFRLLSDGKEVAAIDERYLDVVIVNAAPKVARTFYAGTFSEDNVAAPVCWSADGDKPDAAVKQKCAPTCAVCPNNQKGSGQGDTRACRFSQRMAVLLANDVEGDVMQLTVPATSIFGKAEGSEYRPLQDYARFHAAQGNDISMMVTRVKFDTSVATPKVFFKAMRWLTDEEYAITSEKGASAEAIQAITMTVSQLAGVPAAAAPAALPGPKPKAPFAAAPADDEDEAPAPTPVKKAKAAPAPAVEDDEEEAPAPAAAKAKRTKATPAPKEYPQGGDEDEATVPEPAVKKSASAAPAAPASAGLAAVLGEWDDE